MPKKNFINSEYGHASEVQFGMVHKPIAVKAMNIRDAKAADDTVREPLNSLPAWDFKKCKFESELGQQPKNDGKPVHFASLMDFWYLKTPSLRNISTHYDLWSGKTTLKTTVRTEQCSCSKERQLCKWLQQLSGVRFPRLLGMNGEANEALSACAQASSFRKCDWWTMKAHKCG